MKILKNFFECYFNQSFDFDELDGILQSLKNPEDEAYRLQFIIELHQIMQTKNYLLASRIIDKYGNRTLNLSQTKQLIKYMYNKLTGQPAYIDRNNFVKDCKVVFCPVCCPDPEKSKIFSLIKKATIIEKNMQIFICKPCKLVWLTEDIRANNAQDYKEFMKRLGLKGLWKELSNVDLL
ncbi:hypothetical protein ACFLYH_01345 [Candidatus Dependentiae bacterium]